MIFIYIQASSRSSTAGFDACFGAIGQVLAFLLALAGANAMPSALAGWGGACMLAEQGADRQPPAASLTGQLCCQ